MIKYQIRKIAIAVNFSAESENAVRQAALIARDQGTSLDIIHAVSPGESRNKKAEYVSNAYAKLKAYGESVAKEFSGVVKVFARVGDTLDFIYKYSVDQKIDLLVIGAGTGAKKLWGETTAYDIIMKIECPVLSVPPGFCLYPFRKILFPVRDVAGVVDKLVYTKPFTEDADIDLICLGDPGIDKIRELKALATELGIVFNAEADMTSVDKMGPSYVISASEKAHNDLIVINATKEKEWYNIFGENYTAYILKESSIAVLSITHQFESA